MAFVEMPITHFVELKDRGGNVARLQFKSNGTASLAADQLSDALLAAIDPLTDAKVIKYGYTSMSMEDDLSVTADNGEIENRAEIVVALETETPPTPGQTRYAGISIPAPVVAMFQATSGALFNVVNPNYAPLQTFLGLFEYGLVLPALTLSDYQTILDPAVAGNVVGKRIHKKSRKG